MSAVLTVSRTLVRPAVWIGCLACYNGGNLVGRWFPTEEAGEVTPEDLHSGPTAHEELWCLDFEGFPAHTGEMSPHTASLWGELHRELGEAQWPALLAWVESGSCVVDSNGLPDLTLFEDRYRGCEARSRTTSPTRLTTSSARGPRRRPLLRCGRLRAGCPL